MNIIPAWQRSLWVKMLTLTPSLNLEVLDLRLLYQVQRCLLNAMLLNSAKPFSDMVYILAYLGRQTEL